MPILNYKCRECGKEFAKIFFAEEDAPRECPVCHAEGPEELGPAFNQDRESLKRLLCVSCETCGDEGSCSEAPSS
ncbi:MAG: zinc ribbon domain-containing protein [Desulfomonilaceae bacterium]